jgi:Recombinase
LAGPQEGRVVLAGERAADLRPTVAKLKAAGASSLRQIAARLNNLAIPMARGGSWSAVQVERVLKRV